jgi:oligopeptide transport system permease protein
MMQTWIKGLLQLPVTLLLLCTVTFFLVRLTPGGPFSTERDLDPIVEQALQEKYHLDAPLWDQYLHFLGSLSRGDLGPSFHQKTRSVVEIIGSHLPPSMVLGCWAMSMALLMGLSLGIFSALRHMSAWDLSAMSLSVIGLSCPGFVVGPCLQWLFSLKWPWLPTAGYEGWSGLSHLILPAFALSLPFAARIARLTRGGLLDVLSQDYILTAKSKGLHPLRIFLVHALRGALLPVVSYMGPACAGITTGTLVVERIFQIPGLGREFVESALNRDYTLVMGTVLVYGCFLILSNLFFELVASWLNPRLRQT